MIHIDPVELDKIANSQEYADILKEAEDANPRFK